MNNVFISGHLGRDMDVRAEEESGELVGELSIAINDYIGKDNAGGSKYWTTWMSAVIKGTTRVRRLQDLCTKGRKVTISGALRTRRYRISEEKALQMPYILVDDIEPGPLPSGPGEAQQ